MANFAYYQDHARSSAYVANGLTALAYWFSDYKTLHDTAAVYRELQPELVTAPRL